MPPVPKAWALMPAAVVPALILSAAVILIFAAAANAIVVRQNGHTYGIAPRAGASHVGAQLVRAAPHASTNPCTSGPGTGCLTWGGGPVLHAITPYVVFWDPSSKISSTSRALIERYLADSAADSGKPTNVWAVDRQYYDSQGIADYVQTWASSHAIVDTTAFPGPDPSGFCSASTSAHCLTDAQLRAELSNVVHAGHLPTGMARSAPLYLMVTPADTDICDGTGSCADNMFCAYHSIIGGSSTAIVYAEIPMFETTPAEAKACQADRYWPNGPVQEPNGDPADVALKYLSHEVSESITDPDTVSGWINPVSGNEDGDQCNFYGSPSDPDAGSNVNAFAPTLGGSSGAGGPPGTIGTLYDQIINDDDYYTQTEWSDGNLDCAAQPDPGTITPAFTIPTPTPIQPGTTVTFDPSATTSTTPISSVTWNWGDGTTGCFVATSANSGCSSSSSPLASQAHSYAAAGIYTVKMTAVDANGNVASTSSTVGAPPPAPTASFGYLPAVPLAGLPVSFDGSGSRDSRGHPVTSYSWSFGDGSATATGVTPSHVYARTGSYTVTLTVTAGAGVTGSITKQITVTTGPGAGLSSATPVARRPTSFTAASSQDAAAAISTYAWDFGDGSPPAAGAAVSHTYGLAGTFPVTLTITDTLGLTSRITRLVTVFAAPTPSFALVTSRPVTGAASKFDATASGDSSGPIVSYTWSFGDGGSAVGVSASHAYARPGTYQVTLTVTDANGIASETASMVPVVAAATVTRLSATQSGRAVVVRARLSGVGKLTVAGRGRTIRRAGTVSLTIPLSGAQHGTITIKVVFVPALGGVTSKAVKLRLH